MRSLLGAALLLISAIAGAQDAPKPMSIALDPLGDRDEAVIARVSFRFAKPRAVTEAGLFLEGSFTQKGRVPRNFRFAVPRNDDNLIWNNTTRRNGRIVRITRWSLLPDQRNELTVVRAFDEGPVEIDAWLVLERDYGAAPVVVARATETFTSDQNEQPVARAR